MKNPISAKAKDALARVLFLREYYRGGDKIGALPLCPLCRLHCDSCPWPLFEGQSCLDAHRDIVAHREHPSARWRDASIKRLTRWARLIRNGTYDKKLKGVK